MTTLSPDGIALTDLRAFLPLPIGDVHFTLVCPTGDVNGRVQSRSGGVAW